MRKVRVSYFLPTVTRSKVLVGKAYLIYIWSVKLSECRRGDRGHLTSVAVQPCYQLRVQELGLRPGAQFVVTNRATFGGIVLNVGGTRVAVDVRSSKLIDVEVA